MKATKKEICKEKVKKETRKGKHIGICRKLIGCKHEFLKLCSYAKKSVTMQVSNYAVNYEQKKELILSTPNHLY